jgi:RNA polymerase sigma factor (sigma-70 family)
MSNSARLIQLVQGTDLSAGPALTDTDLLHWYAAERDESAFAELVRRNGPLVLRTCRHVLGEAHADDAFQTVFLILARSADRLTGSRSLAGWLHASAVRIAQRVRRGERRRHKREVAHVTPLSAPDELTWKEIREVLDAEIAALP